MFSTAKVYLGIAVTTVISVLFALLKYKSAKLEKTKKELAQAKQDIKTSKIKEQVTKESDIKYTESLEEISNYYEEHTLDQLKNFSDEPLSPSLLERLRNNEGISSNSDTPTK